MAIGWLLCRPTHDWSTERSGRSRQSGLVLVKAPVLKSDFDRRQRPRGEIDFRFFGNDITFEKPSCVVVQVRGQDVTIDVGSAQGVSKGAIYTIHLSDASEQGQHGANFLPMQIRVDHVEEFQSTGKLGNSSPESRATNIVAGEFVGVLNTWAYPQAVTVHLQNDLDIE